MPPNKILVHGSRLKHDILRSLVIAKKLISSTLQKPIENSGIWAGWYGGIGKKRFPAHYF
jgi:hypothetical protein